jgi:hypothetical protein
MPIKITTKASDFVLDNKQQWNFMRFLAEFKNTFDDANKKFGYNLYHDNIYDAADNLDKLKLSWDLDELPKLVCNEDGIAWWPDKNTLSECTWKFVRDELVIAILEKFSNIIDGDQDELAEKVRKRKLSILDTKIATTLTELDYLKKQRDLLKPLSIYDQLEQTYLNKWIIANNGNSLYHVKAVGLSSSLTTNRIVITSDCSIELENLKPYPINLKTGHDSYIYLDTDDGVQIIDSPFEFVKNITKEIEKTLTEYIAQHTGARQ